MQNTIALKKLLSRHDLWQGDHRSASTQVFPTGHNALDTLLRGGWPQSALVELAYHREGIGELSLLTPTLVDATQGNRLCVLLDPPYQPYAPAWAAAHINLENLCIVRSRCLPEWLWAAEHSVRNGALLLAWAGRYKLSYSALRRLQLATVDNQQYAFLYQSLARLAIPSPAPLRLEINSPALHQLAVTLRKLRGMVAGSQVQFKVAMLDTQRTPLNQLAVPIGTTKDSRLASNKADNRVSHRLNA